MRYANLYNCNCSLKYIHFQNMKRMSSNEYKQMVERSNMG